LLSVPGKTDEDRRALDRILGALLPACSHLSELMCSSTYHLSVWSGQIYTVNWWQI
jgi:hypothetical protein